MIGKIHSFESFGTVDGPGIRFVIFMQGCPMRCLFCHNPDTWAFDNPGKQLEMTPEALVAEVIRYKNFICPNGGVTVSGGEPLLQASFVYEFFKLCHAEGIHTTLDTSGCYFNDDVKTLLSETDLVLLDVKTLNPNLHPKLTGFNRTHNQQLLDYLQEQQIPVWIRHVIVPSLTDDDEWLENLAIHISRYDNVQKVELLPYHDMGKYKYENLGIDYALKEVAPLSRERLMNAKAIMQKHVACEILT